MRLTLAQTSLKSTKKDNLDNMIKVMSENKKTSDLILFPEMIMGGKTDSLGLSDLAEDVENGAFASALREACVRHKTAVCACLWEDSGTERVYNTAVVYDKHGAVTAKYRKLHLFDALAVKESDDMLAGSDLPPVFELEGIMCSLAICYDLRFPEVFRSAVFRGAELLLVPSAWYDGEMKAEHLTTLLKARALENTVYAACADLCGGCFSGHSGVYGPYGECVASAGTDEKVISILISKDRITEIRKKLPCIDNFRMDVFRR
ncbi:MAG: carbon-nitrogen hydrolase family protein [Deferribacterales bacterium]